MVYRRTEKVARRFAERHSAILAAAHDLACESGLAAVQIAAVAERAGVAAGTLYRHFASKEDLVAALLSAGLKADVAAVRDAADAAPGPLTALAAALSSFASRVLANPRLAAALLAPAADAVAPAYRRALIAEFGDRIARAMAARLLPEQDADLAAAAVVGALQEALLGPLETAFPAALRRSAAAALTLFLLRGLGIADAHARGLLGAVGLPATPPQLPLSATSTPGSSLRRECPGSPRRE